MNKEQKALWNKLESFNLDDEHSTFQFTHRLARENGWKISFAKKVMEEYKKFLFLCCISKSSVTPSDEVDQAWHLHLTYTKSYWVDLCKNTLEKDIHHNPTKGGKNESEKFDSDYKSTKTLYTEIFADEPPEEIWPDNEKRFSDVRFQRVNLKTHWLLPKPKMGRFQVQTSVFLFLGLLFIQSQSKDDTGSMLVLFACLGLVVYGFFSGKGGGNSGCSGAGCDSGHSGCGGDSGCGSGCGGCGGD